MYRRQLLSPIIDTTTTTAAATPDFDSMSYEVLFLSLFFDEEAHNPMCRGI